MTKKKLKRIILPVIAVAIGFVGLSSFISVDETGDKKYECIWTITSPQNGHVVCSGSGSACATTSDCVK